MQIPPPPDPLGVCPCIRTGERIPLPEPETDDRGYFDLRHLIVKLLVECDQFPGLQVAPIENSLLRLQDMLVKGLLDPGLRPAPQPDLLELQEELRDRPDPRNGRPETAPPECQGGFHREAGSPVAPVPDRPEPAVHRVQAFDSRCVEVPGKEENPVPIIAPIVPPGLEHIDHVLGGVELFP